MEKLLTTADIDGEDIVQYYLDQVATGDSRPAEVVLALLADWWPGRTFRQSVSNEGLYLLEDFVDDETGKTAKQLFLQEWRKVRAASYDPDGWIAGVLNYEAEREALQVVRPLLTTDRTRHAAAALRRRGRPSCRTFPRLDRDRHPFVGMGVGSKRPLTTRRTDDDRDRIPSEVARRQALFGPDDRGPDAAAPALRRTVRRGAASVAHPRPRRPSAVGRRRLRPPRRLRGGERPPRPAYELLARRPRPRPVRALRRAVEAARSARQSGGRRTLRVRARLRADARGLLHRVPPVAGRPDGRLHRRTKTRTRGGRNNEVNACGTRSRACPRSTAGSATC